MGHPFLYSEPLLMARRIQSVRLGLVVAAIGHLEMLSPVQAAIPASCDADGRCSGLAQVFYLPSTNTLDAISNIQGRVVFKDARIGGCVTLDPQQSSYRNFKTFETKDELFKSLTTDVTTGDFTIDPVKAVYTLGGSFTPSTKHEIDIVEEFKSVTLDIEMVNSVANMKLDSTCLFPDNLDATFKASFESLALPDPAKAGESFSWAAYSAFLKNWGTHIQVQQQFGSRVQDWQSTKTNTTTTVQELKAKACLDIESVVTGGGWSAQSCAEIDKDQRVKASVLDVNGTRYISGGSASTRAALIGTFNEANLNAFLASSTMSDQPIGFKYLAIWSVLQEIYRGPCGQDGKDSTSCNNLQRAMALQAAFEGFGAYACSKQLDARNGIIQTMLAQGPDSLGIYYYACHESKTGCRENSDCTRKDDAIGQCSCGGGSCIDSQAYAGTTVQKNFVRGTADSTLFGSRDGVNASCRDSITCDCDEGWAGGELERNIWDQALGGSAVTNSPIAKSAVVGLGPFEARASSQGGTGTTRNYYKLHVDVGTQEILSKTEAKIAEKAISGAVGKGDQQHGRVLSTPVGIDCPGVCVATFKAGTEVRLSYVDNADHQFVEWTGTGCAKKSNHQKMNGKNCVIANMDEVKRVGAVFKIAPR